MINPEVRDVFIPVADGPVTVAAAGDVTPIYGQGVLAQYFDYSDSLTLDHVPSFVDGKFLHNSSTGNPAGASVLTLTGLPAHDSIDLDFVLALLDGWDGDGAGGPDRFNVTVDGVSVFSHSLSNTPGKPQSYTPVTGIKLIENSDRGFGAGDDSFYELGRDAAFRNIPHTADTLAIRWFADGAGWTGGDEESWAIDNVRVRLNTGSGSQQVFATDFNRGVPEQFSGVTTLADVAGFGPLFSRVEPYPSRSGFADERNLSDTTFAVRWSGQIYVDQASIISFISYSDDSSRVYIDGQLVVDTDVNEEGSISLDQGYHDFLVAYYQNDQDAYCVVGWKPEGETDYEYIPFDWLVRADGTHGDPARRVDLLVSDGNRTMVYAGRPPEAWAGQPTESFPPENEFSSMPAGGITGLGDVNADGHDDFGILNDDKLVIYSGSPEIAGPTVDLTLQGDFEGMQLLSAGDVNAGGKADILLTGPAGRIPVVW